jgi:hypothetical protein
LMSTSASTRMTPSIGDDGVFASVAVVEGESVVGIGAGMSASTFSLAVASLGSVTMAAAELSVCAASAPALAREKEEEEKADVTTVSAALPLPLSLLLGIDARPCVLALLGRLSRELPNPVVKPFKWNWLVLLALLGRLFPHENGRSSIWVWVLLGVLKLKLLKLPDMSLAQLRALKSDLLLLADRF